MAIKAVSLQDPNNPGPKFSLKGSPVTNKFHELHIIIELHKAYEVFILLRENFGLWCTYH